ncbi:ribosome recycling factor [Bacteroidia bacterium]|jgi:ribosome recycling factor|nr:ribosome recycling factor [Bacteroidota bacterium]MDA9110897.1 ribosome recycling factor [Bacteroidia bacterium]MDB4174180.1 ribosome recycling factor [Bacteroidia bacterium]
MNEDVKIVLDELKEASDKALKHVAAEVGKLRAGKAAPQMLDSVMVEYYGSKVPLSQVANVNTPDAKTIMVKPWEKGMIDEISKGIMYANLGLNPQNDGEQVIINVPPLTEERRLQLVKQAKGESEHGKIGLRSARKDAIDTIKMLQKDGLGEDMAKDAEAEVQKVIDTYSKRIDETIAAKEVEIMKI